MAEQQILDEIRRLELLVLGAGKPLLTSEEAAAYTGCAPYTIREMARRKEIPHYKDRGGRKLRVLKKDLDEWMQYTRIASTHELESKAVKHTTRKRY